MMSEDVSYSEIILKVNGGIIPQKTVKQKKQAHKEEHIEAGQLLKSLIYGGIDGCINTLLIIVSGVSSGASAYEIFIICISSILADAIGMGLGDYLSAKAEIRYAKSEEQRQLYEVKHLLQCQKEQIIQLYQKYYQLEDSQRIADLYATNHQAFVNIMMLQELGLVVTDESVALKCGIVTFCCFAVFGGIPALPYIISAGIQKKEEHQWIAVICIGIVELFSLGFAKAALIGLKPWKSGFQSLVLSSIIVGIGYGLGFIFQ